jgi:hypothetical protein
MRNIKLFILVFIFSTGSSCSKHFLEEDPKGLVIPDIFFQNTSEISQAVNGVYYFLGNAEYYRQTLWNKGGAPTDEMTVRPDLRKGEYIFDDPSLELPGTWKELFAAINAANVTIRGIKASPVAEATKNPYLAEARFLRALTYFNATLFWGELPLITDETPFNEAITLGRARLNDIWSLIIEDMKFAENNLPNNYGGTITKTLKSRATKWAAKALLARMYLYKKEWANARDKALEVVNSGLFSLMPVFNDVFETANEQGPEILFTTEYKANVRGGLRHTSFLPRKDVEGYADLTGYGSYLPTKYLISLYDDNDKRKNSTLMTTYKGQPLTRTYFGTKFIDLSSNPEQGDRDYIIIRYAEVFLIIAEAENELNGPTTLAYSNINEIRDRAGLDPLSNLSKDEFTGELRQERSRELVGEGHRRWDLIRWGIFIQAVRNIDPFDLTIAQENVAERHNLFPVPSVEIAKNPNLLPNNPGY